MQATLTPGDRTTNLSATELSLSVEELGRTLEAFFRQRQLPVAVRCALQGDCLLVVGNHRIDMPMNPRQVLQILEARIHALQIRSIQQVGLYLRIVGQPKPYVRRQFLLNQAPPKPVLSGIAASATAGTGAIAPPAAIPIPKPVPAAPPARPAGFKAPQPIAPKDSDSIPAQGSRTNSQPAPRASAPTADAGADHRLLLAGIGAVGLALGSYVLTQPCTIGACPQLQTAELLGNKSFTVVTQAPAAPDLAAAQQYLTGAIDLLDTVPIWSRHRDASSKLRQQYQQQSDVLKALMQADQLAIAATQSSEAPVLNPQAWQLIRNQWEAAIQQLESVPVASPFYASATAKLERYRDQFALVQTRLQQEEAAGQRLTEAKQLLKLAWERQQHAISQKRPDLAEAVVATWEAGIDRLQQVPSNTSATFEAERLLAVYQPRVAKIKADLAAAMLLRKASANAQAANQPAQPVAQPTDPATPPDTQPVTQPIQAIAVPAQALTPQQLAQYQMAQQQILQQRMMQQQIIQQMQGQPLPQPPAQVVGQ
ncbi:MAG: hypothetical protein OHK0037_22140 [Elainellaceae cyanobacterium]